MIPKRIYSMWLNENPELPELVKKCLESQKIQGYEHKLITLDNYWKGSEYVNGCIALKKWVKASDVLRMHYLYEEGGIYLDADMEIYSGKNFDNMLDSKLWTVKQNDGVFANGAVASEAGHPLIKEYLRRIEDNFKPSGDLVFEPGVRAFCDLIWKAEITGESKLQGIKIYEPEILFPFDHQKGTTVNTEKTIGFHHYMKSWLVKK